MYVFSHFFCNLANVANMRFLRNFLGNCGRRFHLTNIKSVILFFFRCNLLTTVQSDPECKRGLISSLDRILFRFDLRHFEEEESLVAAD